MGEYADYFIEQELGFSLPEVDNDPTELRKATPAQEDLAKRLAEANGIQFWKMSEDYFVLKFICRRKLVLMDVWPLEKKTRYNVQPQFKSRLYLNGNWNILKAVRELIRATRNKKERVWFNQ